MAARMNRIRAVSDNASKALELVSALQYRFVRRLEKLAGELGSAQSFNPVEWARDKGIHGGGIRFETADGDLFGRGSVNVSQVHYDDLPDRKLGSANALSSIIHPLNPLAPSVHIHISWTEMKSGAGYWRIMADLNPSSENRAHTAQFLAAMQAAAPAQFDEAVARGERYFFIPALGRHRGAAHFYLEHFNTADAQADYDLAKTAGEAVIDIYPDILADALNQAADPTDEQRARQLAYHTLYFFQVLTLDRGTTTGLLAHDQNDVGIMASLPACVDRDLLSSWIAAMQSPQDQLLDSLIAVLPDASPALVDEDVKRKLAAVVRGHYAAFPQAIAMQASGDVAPPAVSYHRNCSSAGNS
jgi:coproporphyrinogen III oxidase